MIQLQQGGEDFAAGFGVKREADAVVFGEEVQGVEIVAEGNAGGSRPNQVQRPNRSRTPVRRSTGMAVPPVLKPRPGWRS